jgi:two-component system chemotaxis response regulator CheB
MSDKKPIRVLVVDDSAVIREIISDSLREAPDMELAGTAADGERALAVLEEARPDVVTLDVQMPKMDGLATLEAILARRPVPVIMVSALTQLGANTTFEALERGAVDYVAKPTSGAQTASVLHDELLRKIRAMAGTDVARLLRIRRERKEKAPARAAAAPEASVRLSKDELARGCIVLGISTGGPPALARLFETLRPPLPPVAIVQHMPSGFTKTLAWRLDSLSGLSVKEAEQGDVFEPGRVLVAPGGQHLQLVRRSGRVTAALVDGENVSGHKPSADVLLESAAAIYGPRCLGVIMTGMGRDGADGCAAIRAAGGFVLGQDEESSDVYGMNKVAFVEGHVNRQFHLREGAAQIMQQARRMCERGVPVGI